jgi:hypothetical protein
LDRAGRLRGGFAFVREFRHSSHGDNRGGGVAATGFPYIRMGVKQLLTRGVAVIGRTELSYSSFSRSA